MCWVPVVNNGKDCAFKWVRKTENAAQRPKNESAFNGGIVVAVPVLSIEQLLNHLVLFLVVITEIELAGNNIIPCSNHRFKELNVPVCGLYSHERASCEKSRFLCRLLAAQPAVDRPSCRRADMLLSMAIAGQLRLDGAD